MEIIFPCGAKGRAEFCPGVCQYGKFCKIKEQKEEPKPRGLAGLEEDAKQAEVVEDKEESKVEFYY